MRWDRNRNSSKIRKKIDVEGKFKWKKIIKKLKIN
jgi:hypothetical protein